MNMRKVWIITRHEYLVNVRRPGFIIMTLLVPMLGALGLAVTALFGSQAASFFESQFNPLTRPIGIVDQSGAFTPLLPEYEGRFVAFPDEASGRAAVEAEEIGVLLVIPADYLESGNVTIISRESGFGVQILEDTDEVKNFFVDHLLRDSVDPALRERVLNPLADTTVVTLTAGEEAAGEGGPLNFLFNFFVPYFLGILLVVTIFTSSGYLLRSVSDEKISRVIEIVLSSVTATELLTGKVLGLGAVGLTQVAVWLISAAALSGGALTLFGVAVALLTRPSVFILSVIYYILGFLLYAVLMGSAGSLGTTQQEAQQIAGIFSFAAAMPMMIVGFIFANPNATIARVLSWFPLTAPTMMMLRLTLGDVLLVDIVGSIAVCLISIPFVLWIGAKVFRLGLLMYGKRPGPREIVRLLRQA